MSRAFRVVKDFEDCLSEYTGAPFVVTVDTCSSAILLCCKYAQVSDLPEVEIPSRTYPSVPCSVIHAGGRVKFSDFRWLGSYQLKPTNVWDCAKGFKRGMYRRGALMCLSFHSKKSLPLGRGGAILTDDPKASEWLKMMRYSGRHEVPLTEDTFEDIGYCCYMAPEMAARGLELMQFIGDDCTQPYEAYQDLSKYTMYTRANR